MAASLVEASLVEASLVEASQARPASASARVSQGWSKSGVASYLQVWRLDLLYLSLPVALISSKAVAGRSFSTYVSILSFSSLALLQANLRPGWSQLGANLEPTWGNLRPSWANLGQLEANLGQLEANLEPT